jgi:amino acid transporter
MQMEDMVGGAESGDHMLRRHEVEELQRIVSWENAERGEGFGETDVVDLDLNAVAPPDSEELSDSMPLLRHDVQGGGVPPSRGGLCCRRQKISAPMVEKPKHLLNQWTASAISGNDITSSVLYMGAFCTSFAGPFAPVSIVLVVLLLFLFRSVYSEVVTALPLNGGAYNALLNTTSKLVAAIGGTLTVLSYVATAVVSATSAVQYFSSLLPQVPAFWLPVAVLSIFALLTLLGITESSIVALIIFAVHMLTLLILMVACLIWLFVNGWPMMASNWSPAVYELFGNPFTCIALGFGTALLGVSGFESSANYVEEQAPGVFPKTLRNMWLAVAFFNPVLTILAIGMIDVRIIRYHANNCVFDPLVANFTEVMARNMTGNATAACDPMLTQMAELAGGQWLSLLVGIDATLVLCGAVLTAYVGVGGLIRRMSLDRCFPSFFLMQNPVTKTNHFIILAFFITSSSLYLIASGDLEKLAGVYAIAFLCVMGLFASANMLLKYKRSKLKRAVKSSWPGVVVAFLGVLAGLIINVVRDVSIIEYFAIYFAVFLALSLVMFVRVKILRLAFNLMKHTRLCRGACGGRMRGWVKSLNKQPVVFFTNNGLLSVLNKAITYIRDNEFTDRVIVVHLYEGDISAEPLKSKMHRIQTNVRILDRMYPKSRISLVFARGRFGKEAVGKVSELLKVPRNFMFMGAPAVPVEGAAPVEIAPLTTNIAELGGLRLITH